MDRIAEEHYDTGFNVKLLPCLPRPRSGPGPADKAGFVGTSRKVDLRSRYVLKKMHGSHPKEGRYSHSSQGN
jgi:hypothetical protein